MFIKICLTLCLTIGISFNSLYCSPTRTSKYVNPSTFISKLPDGQLLHNLALIGTYQSASIQSFPYIRTQNLTIREQLESGIRVLDIHLRLEDDQLRLYYGPVLLLDSIDEVFKDIYNFFQQNPGELVIIIMKIEGDEAFSDMTECQAVNKYVKKWNLHGLSIVGDWSLLEDNIGEHRGHVLLGHVNSQDFADCTADLPCEVQNNWLIADFDEKWRVIKESEDNMLNAYHPYHSCYVNYLASLNPLLFTHANSSAEDITVRLKQIEEINHRMANYFNDPEDTLAIVITEYPSQELIESIVSSNFE